MIGPPLEFLTFRLVNSTITAQVSYCMTFMEACSQIPAQVSCDSLGLPVSPMGGSGVPCDLTFRRD